MITVRFEGPGGSSDVTPVAVVPFVIGRELDCDLVVPDERVSRRHAQLEVQDDGRVVLRDLASANGTYAGDRRVEGGIWFDVPGAFRVGRTLVTVDRVQDASAAGEPVVPDRGSSGPARRWLERDRPVRLTLVRAFLGFLGAANALGGVAVLVIALGTDSLQGMLLASTIASIVFGVGAIALAFALPRRDPWVWRLGVGFLLAWILVGALFAIVIILGGGPITSWLGLVFVAVAVGWLRSERTWWMPMTRGS